MMRDLRSWLIKESIIKYYRTDLDVVVPAVEYLRYILETHLYTHAARIRMEDLIQQNEATIGKLSEFLKLELFRSEEHTSELQSRGHLVCRLLLEKKKKKTHMCI